jgi:hypothetical protein
MADIVWTTRYRPRSRSGIYNIDTPDLPLTLWATDQMSQKYDELLNVMQQQMSVAHRAVRMRSRVDTGYMQAHALATETHSPRLLSISFGWFENDPFYARFQEYGTRTGIKPMMAVQKTYHEVWARVKTEVGR